MTDVINFVGDIIIDIVVYLKKQLKFNNRKRLLLLLFGIFLLPLLEFPFFVPKMLVSGLVKASNLSYPLSAYWHCACTLHNISISSLKPLNSLLLYFTLTLI